MASTKIKFSKSELYLLSMTGLLAFPFTHLICQRFLKWFWPSISTGSKFRISTRMVSAFQALIVVCFARRTVANCKDILRDEDPYLHAYIWFGASYFPYDVIVMYMGYRYTKECIDNERKHAGFLNSFLAFFRRECVIVSHHLVFFAVGFPAVEFYKNGLGDFFVACFLLAEISTPFYSIRGILKELEIHKGPIFNFNGLIFVTTFLIGRVLSVPYMYWKFARFSGLYIYQVFLKLPMKCNVLSLCFLCLQCYWFSMICKGILKHLDIRKSTHARKEIKESFRNNALFCNGDQKHK